MASSTLLDGITASREPGPALAVPRIPAKPLSAKGRLFDLQQLNVTFEESSKTLWTFMRPQGRPSYNLPMLADFHVWQDGIPDFFAGREDALRYLVLGSDVPGVFNLGGDLKFFAQKIREQNREALLQYGRSCVHILYRNMTGLNLPIVTIGLVQGDALGGGFESLLSFDVIVAERSAKFGLPENLFGLFPGMGAYSFLARRLGPARAEAMILSGRIHTAEEMHAYGIVHVLADDGDGERVVRDYITRNAKRHSAHRAIYRAGREVNPVTLSELERIVEIWADASLRLRDQDLKVMERLVAAQDRLRPAKAALI